MKDQLKEKEMIINLKEMESLVYVEETDIFIKCRDVKFYLSYYALCFLIFYLY